MANATATKSRPLKWAGGKTHLIERMRSLYSPDRRWVDLFCGSLALPLALKPKVAILADTNWSLINFWRWVQFDGVVRHIKMVNDSEHYYQCRVRFNEIVKLDYNPEAAELFYYLNRTGFNGLCRFNKQGGFNVPFGKYKTINYCQDFTDLQPVMSGWDFICCDFRAMKSRIHPSDFVYADPPYHGTFTDYSAGGFSWANQVALADMLAGHNHCVASNSWHPGVVRLYQERGFQVEEITAPRSISCKGDRGAVIEMLAIKL